MRIETLPAREATSGKPVTLAAPASAGDPRGQAIAADGKALPVVEVPPPADLSRAVEQIEQFLRESGRQLTISVDGPTGRMVVAVRDAATGELIRQIPNEETLRIARNLEAYGPALVSEFA